MSRPKDYLDEQRWADQDDYIREVNNLDIWRNRFEIAFLSALTGAFITIGLIALNRVP